MQSGPALPWIDDDEELDRLLGSVLLPLPPPDGADAATPAEPPRPAASASSSPI